MHQDIQEKVVDELRTVYYDADEVTDADTLSKLVHTEMVIKEGMRLMPIVPFMIRTAMEDIPIGLVHLQMNLIPLKNIMIHFSHQQYGSAGRCPYTYSGLSCPS